MTRTRLAKQSCLDATQGVCLLTGLLLILIIACDGSKINESRFQAEQKPAEPHVKHMSQTGISPPDGQQGAYVSNEVLVKFKPETGAETIARIQAEMQLETVRKFSSPNLFLMKITDGSSVETIIQQLKTYEAVKYAEPNYVVEALQ